MPRRIQRQAKLNGLHQICTCPSGHEEQDLVVRLLAAAQLLETFVRPELDRGGGCLGEEREGRMRAVEWHRARRELRTRGLGGGMVRTPQRLCRVSHTSLRYSLRVAGAVLRAFPGFSSTPHTARCDTTGAGSRLESCKIVTARRFWDFSPSREFQWGYRR